MVVQQKHTFTLSSLHHHNAGVQLQQLHRDVGRRTEGVVSTWFADSAHQDTETSVTEDTPVPEWEFELNKVWELEPGVAKLRTRLV